VARGRSGNAPGDHHGGARVGRRRPAAHAGSPRGFVPRSWWPSRNQAIWDLRADDEYALITGALAAEIAAGRLVVQRAAGTLDAVKQALRDEDPDVLHFIGHGGIESDVPGVYLEGSGPQRAGVFTNGLALEQEWLIAPGQGARRLRLVVLNACQTRPPAPRATESGHDRPRAGEGRRSSPCPPNALLRAHAVREPRCGRADRNGIHRRAARTGAAGNAWDWAAPCWSQRREFHAGA
jgi:hypothetical protein